MIFMPGFFSAQLLGLDAWKAAMDKLEHNTDLAAKEAVSVAAQIAEAEIKGQFQGAHAKHLPHVGGDQPNIVTGRLRASVHADVVAQVGPGQYGTFVGPRMVYGRRVELGYRGSRGYPYTHPGFEKAKPKIAAAQGSVLRKYLTRG